MCEIKLQDIVSVQAPPKKLIGYNYPKPYKLYVVTVSTKGIYSLPILMDDLQSTIEWKSAILLHSGGAGEIKEGNAFTCCSPS